MSLTEYIVTLKRRQDLDAFYKDMEQSGCSCVNVPEREVECYARRAISRNTHYLLSVDEAIALRDDERVLAVEAIEDIPVITSNASQTSYFNRGLDPDTNHTEDWHNTDKNWALYRNFIDSNVANWGKSNPPDPSDTPRVNDTISWDLEGQDVDLVILDTLLDPNHPEYAVNADGTGGSRVQNIDWVSYNQLEGPGAPVFWKSFLHDPRESHGALCGSTAAGNTHGLARKANIYAINSTDRPKYGKFVGTRTGNVLTITSVAAGSEPLAVGQRVIGVYDSAIGTNTTISSFGTGTGGIGTYNLSSTPSDDALFEAEYFTCFSTTGQNYMWDYVRAFHRYKPVNPTTNRRNPTVANCSFGLQYYMDYSLITSVQYRGTTYTSSNHSWTPTDLQNDFGLMPYGLGFFQNPSGIEYLGDSTSIRADIDDAIEDGILVVAASGNTGNKIDVVGGNDYNNTFNNSTYYHRGLWGLTDAIVVGDLDSKPIERKSDGSSCGPRVDVYVGGTDIIGTHAGNDIRGQVVSWSRTNNVVTFNLGDEYYNLTNADYATTLSNIFNVRIEMTTTTSLNGVYPWGASFTTPPATNPTGFTMTIPGPDQALTTEIGYFYNADEEHSRIYEAGIIDDRDQDSYLYFASGTSFAAPMVSGLAACWIGYFGRLDRDEYKALLDENCALNKMSTTANDNDYNDLKNLLGAPNKIQQYAQFRRTSGFCYPQNTHKARSTATQKGQTSYVAFPRQRVLRYGA